MEFTFTYTTRDFDEFYQIKWAEDARLRCRRNWQNVVSLAVAFAILGSLNQLRYFLYWRSVNSLSPTAAYDWEGPWLVPFALILAGSLILAAYYFLRNRWRKRGVYLFRRRPTLQQPHTISIHHDFIACATPLNSAQYRWVSFTSWQETSNLFALRLTGRTGVIVIPKRAATDEEQKQLREILNARIVTPTGAFPVTISSPDH
jgi:hypothetical protein